MEQGYLEAEGLNIPVHHIETIIIGSGCAGLNAADCLFDLGKRNIALVTEGMNKGTSRNAGSDKQTYYKLSLSSDSPDSVGEMAGTLFSGGSVNGDIALVEAACSVRCFMKLVNLGVPFPTNIYGEYAGYKTDHDPRQRATSAGPLTSRYMTECLERSVRAKNIEIFDNMQAVRLLAGDGSICGVLAVDLAGVENGAFGLTLFRSSNVIMATGGPAGAYYQSVYPESQTGSTGMALEAGAAAVNLQEWQYGLASVKFRWNVSGTYQQVLPRYISVDRDGNEREFLTDYYTNPYKALDMVFLKGYQWPFDVAKLSGSSMIDLLVHRETAKGNRVYMDFTREPSGLEKGFGGLSSETHDYLRNSGALLSLPVRRLEKMNSRAIGIFKQNGIDLYSEPLEIAVCAQHCNGGIAVDINWESGIGGLYAVGEAAGTFGVYRPGGSALNSTQVGALRAAEHIARKKPAETVCKERFESIAKESLTPILSMISQTMKNWDHHTSKPVTNIPVLQAEAQKLMSAHASHIRDIRGLESTDEYIAGLLDSYGHKVWAATAGDIPGLFRFRDILLTQKAMLSAMLKSATDAGSRGSALVCDKGTPDDGMDTVNMVKPKPGSDSFDGRLVTTRYRDGGFVSDFEPVRPIPERDDWFENVWNDYIRRNNIDL